MPPWMTHNEFEVIADFIDKYWQHVEAGAEPVTRHCIYLYPHDNQTRALAFPEGKIVRLTIEFVDNPPEDK